MKWLALKDRTYNTLTVLVSKKLKQPFDFPRNVRSMILCYFMDHIVLYFDTWYEIQTKKSGK